MKMKKLSSVGAALCTAVFLCCIMLVGSYNYNLSCARFVIKILISAAAAAGLYSALKYLCKKGFITRKGVCIFYFICCALLLAAQILLTVNTRYSYNLTDPKIIGKAAEQLAKTGSCEGLPERYMVYLAKYPNTWGMVFFDIPFYKLWYALFGEITVAAAQTLNIIMIQLSAVFTFLTAKLIFRKPHDLLFCGILTLSCPVFLFYAPSPHTDALSMGFVSVSLYLFTRAVMCKSFKKQLGFLVGMSAVLSVGCTVKGSILIMLIACCIVLVLKFGIKRGFVLALVPVVMYAAVSKAVFYGGIAVGISDEQMLERYRMPAVHWIMMSLNEEGETHSDKDVEFTLSFETYDEKCAADKEELKNRVSRLNSPSKVKEHIYHKLVQTWDSPTCGAVRWANLDNKNADPLIMKIFGSAAMQRFFDCALWTMYLLMLFGMIYSVLPSKKSTVLLCTVTAAGIILFLLMWENPSRYRIPFIPMFILLSTSGARFLNAAAVRAVKRIKKRRK
ncbi:MAG: hypothetical protein ACI4JW_01015 [Oscillospiraceae bacterium]